MSKKPRLVTSSREAHRIVLDVRDRQQRIGLVPTMGNLHDGHLSLVQAARQECDYVVVTIFVNPTQFAPDEDFEKYPRSLEKDLAQQQALDVDLVFAPGEKEIYPDGISTLIEPPAIAQPWEGVHRPHHFAGVVTVVSKLFKTLPADMVFLGQKDYQQAMVIQQLIADLNCPTELHICPIVRDTDGLALSSRNRYLDHQQRDRASGLFTCLQQAQQLVEQGERSTRTLTNTIRQQLGQADIEQVDYVAIVNPTTLTEVKQVMEPAMLLLAVQIGEVRLIDNCHLLP